ncbi:hypothetical protein [Acidovorax sp.]|uniref:DUF7673 family protein n=1 Tax=Acidovorax sp. TaxID=1872122 RepID=UPI00391F2764
MPTPPNPLSQVEDWARRARQAQAAAAHAYARLLDLAEDVNSGQAARIAQFIASTYDGAAFPLDPFSLRGLDVGISDDMLLCLDALRWGKAELHELVPDGQHRVQALLQIWGVTGPEDE